MSDHLTYGDIATGSTVNGHTVQHVATASVRIAGDQVDLVTFHFANGQSGPHFAAHEIPAYYEVTR
jgi:hypothetical protein